MSTIKYYTSLAYRILSSARDRDREGMQYFDDRKIIRILFTSRDWMLDKYNNKDQRQKLKARLTIIDSYYSTNVGSRRYDGIDHIVRNICEISNSDNELRNLYIDFLNNISEKHPIGKILINKYGWSKLYPNGLKAISLISKFGYFLTNFQFPICDTYVNSYHTRLFKVFKNQGGFSSKKLPKNDSELSIFKRLIVMNEPIQNFEKLDNLLWLTGKIANGSFSLILCVENHQKLITRIQESDLDAKSFKKKTYKYIYNENNSISDIFSDDLIEFIKLVKQIIPLKIK